jgi:hypothetical protein
MTLADASRQTSATARPDFARVMLECSMIGKNSPSRRWRSASLAPQTAQHCDKSVEHRLQHGWRGADDAEDFAHRRLLLHRFG